MLKLTGLLLAFVGAASVGFYRAALFRRRRRLLVDFRDLMTRIATEIGYFKAPLPQIFQQLAQGDDGETRVLLRSLLTEYQTHSAPLSALWAGAVETAYRGAPLRREDLALLQKCGAFLGQSDYKGQQNHFRLLDQQLERQIAEAEEEIRTRGRLCARLGVAAGLVITVTLL